MNRKGFTLIELLIVVVIIGILAAIAIPKFANTKQKAVRSSMISDLRNLATAEEAFFADSSHYASKVGVALGTDQVAFTFSQGNIVGTTTGDGSGWSAVLTNPGYGSGAKKCGFYVGAGKSATGATAEGVPGCEAVP